MLFRLTEFSYFLDESLPLLETIKFKGLSERIKISWIGPALDTSSINDVGNSSLIHFFKFINASLVELFKLGIKLIEISGGKWEPTGHLGGNLSLLADWNQQVGESSAALSEFQALFCDVVQHFLFIN